MKKIIIIFLLFISSATIYAQKPIDGVMGIKFSSTKQSLMEIAKDKGGKLQKSNDANVLEYSDITFGGRTAFLATFSFVDDKFYQAFLYFKEDKDPQAIALYEELLGNLTKVYGEGNQKRIYREPYQSTTGFDAFKIRRGYATINDIWMKNGNGIILTLGDSMIIGLLYRDGKLYDVANKGKKPLDDY